MLPDDARQDEDYALWPEHVEAVELFVRCITQWRSAANGVIGLDYSVVLQLATLYDVADMQAILPLIQTMELHARQLINKEAG